MSALKVVKRHTLAANSGLDLTPMSRLMYSILMLNLISVRAPGQGSARVL